MQGGGLMIGGQILGRHLRDLASSQKLLRQEVGPTWQAEVSRSAKFTRY